tara:strand:+ start:44 stop:619 length:576 start_codon:yes stop_codon:yes gene_type:complete
MIKSLLRKNPDFIEVYNNVLSKKDCEVLINHFEKSDDVDYGRTLQGYTPDVKKCLQIKLDLEDLSSVSNTVRQKLISCLNQYRKKYSFYLDYTHCWSLYPTASFQKYDGKDDGYKQWHCEHGNDEISSKRIMAWMFYLNNAKSGTEFSDFPSIKAKEGRCVIWPAFWTHTHRGVIPNVGLKYIITGWISYD